MYTVMEALQEITQFLTKSARLDLKAVSLTHVLGLTGSKDGISLISNCPELLAKIIALTEDDSESIRKDAILTLVNISAEENGAEALVEQVNMTSVWVVTYNSRFIRSSARRLFLRLMLQFLTRIPNLPIPGVWFSVMLLVQNDWWKRFSIKF